MLRARGPLLLTSFRDPRGVYFCQRAAARTVHGLLLSLRARARARARTAPYMSASRITSDATLALAPPLSLLFVLTCHVRDVLRVADVS